MSKRVIPVLKSVHLIMIHIIMLVALAAILVAEVLHIVDMIVKRL